MHNLIMRNRNRRWILFWFLVPILQLVSSDETNNTNNNPNRENDDKNPQRLFSPRMDYDQWKPLGRGDPLKNDPTYDYVPPVLDRVLYWKPDPPKTSESSKTEILLLGVTSKKPAKTSQQADSRQDHIDSQVKFVQNPNQRIAKPSFIPSFFPSFFAPKSKYPMRTPYTILMPPPMTESLVTQPPGGYTTAPVPSSVPGGVTVQPSNLIFQSSSVIGSTDWSNRQVTVDSSIAWEQHLPSTKQPDFREAFLQQAPPERYIHMEFAPNNSSLVAAESQTINYVTPPPLGDSDEIMFKGQVADDSLDISNTYVKIVKPEAEVHSTGLGLDELVLHLDHMGELEQMQTMHPPPVTQSPVYTQSTTEATKSTVAMAEVSTTETPTTKAVSEAVTATNEATETTAGSMTTDPLFRHYKQPKEPIKGPLYLIIQGHSKVKTYGPTKQLHGINIQETNEISDGDDGFYQVKHLHGFQMDKLVEPRMARSGNLQTLKHVVQTGYGSIDLSDLKEVVKKHFQEAEVQGGYEVGGEDGVSEEYHKGIVEEARKLKV